MKENSHLKEQPVYISDEKCSKVEPSPVSYEKYCEVEHENLVLKEIIVELNKKLFDLEHKLMRK